MSFLSPWMLWGMAALSAPVLIHLWQRRQVITLPFGTLRFLKIAAKKTRRSAILENLLLLLLRCLLLALLIVAAARPVLPSGFARKFGGSAPRTVVLAVDASMSMGCLVDGAARLAAAKVQALAVLEDLKEGDQVAVIAACGVPKMLIPKPTHDFKIARRMIEGIRITQECSDFPSLFRECRKILEKEVDRSRELFLFTDSQETAWRFDAKTVFDPAWNALAIRTVISRPDLLAPPNRAVSSVKITALVAIPGSLLSGVAVVDNFSDAPIHEVVEIMVGGERLAQLPVDVPPRGGTELTFEGRMPPLQGRLVGGLARIQPDNLTPDDAFHFVLPVAQRARVLVVEGQSSGEELLRSGFYLRKALQFAPDGGSVPPPETASPDQLDGMSLEGFSAVFLADVPSLTDRAAARLERYLQGGGTLVVFPGDLGALSGSGKTGFFPATPLGMTDLPPGRLAAMITDPSHPLVARTWDKSTPFPALPLRKLMRWQLLPGARTLMTFSNGEPFVVAGSLGSGTVLLVNASADRSWGDFPLSPGFLPLVQQIALFSCEHGAFLNALAVGEPLPMTPNLPNDQPLTLRKPDGTTAPIPAGEKTVLLDHSEDSGIYSVFSGKEGAFQLFAVNANRAESDLRPISKENLQQIVPSEMVSGLDSLKIWLTQSKGNIPIWPALLMLALLVFTLEELLSNRLAKTRSQGNERGIRTGRLNKRRFGATFRPGLEEVAP